MINPSSKISLKLSCIASCNGDVDRAANLYKFLAEDITSLPDFDVPKPTTFEQLKQGASQIFSWLKDNREDISQAVSYIQSMRGGASPVQAANNITQEIPPLPHETISS